MTKPIIDRPPAHLIVGPEAGRLPVWDDLYLLGHDDTGAPRLPVEVLGIGLAGAVLIDLLLNQQVAIRDGRISMLEYRARGDVIADTAIGHLRQGSRLPVVPVWLGQFANDATFYERVRAHLLAVGVLRRRRRRLRADVYVPVDTVWTVRAQARLRSILYGHEPADHNAAALCGLVDAVGLHQVLSLPEPDQKVRHGLRVVASTHLPPIRYIIGCVEQLIAGHR